MEEDLVSRLIAVLASDAEVYTDLLHLARRKKDLVVKGELAALEALLEVEQALVQRAGQLEGERLELAATLARGWGVPAESITLSCLKERCRPEQVSRLEEAERGLEGVLSELKEVNQENARLLRRALALIKYSLELLLPEEGAVVYGSRGERETPLARPRAVDRQA